MADLCGHVACGTSAFPGALCVVRRAVLPDAPRRAFRKKVVRRNLRNSFPEKSETELMEIERKFYHYICDYMLEEVKMLRMSFEELCRRMKYDNKENTLP